VIYLEEEVIEILKGIAKVATIAAGKEAIKELVKRAFESLSNKKEKKGR